MGTRRRRSNPRPQLGARAEGQGRPGERGENDLRPIVAKLEARLHFFSISSFIGLDFLESGFFFEFGGGQDGGHKPLPLSCNTTLFVGNSFTAKGTPKPIDPAGPVALYPT